MTHVPAAGRPRAAAFSAGGAMCSEKWDLQHRALSLRQITSSKHLLSLQSHLYLGFSIKTKTKQSKKPQAIETPDGMRRRVQRCGKG